MRKARFLLALSSVVAVCLLVGANRSYLTHKLHKVVVKAKMELSRVRGSKPRLVSIAGESGIPGAQVQALDSRSGWATLTDRHGRFLLPDVMWYPGARYDLIVSTDEQKGKRIHLSAPSTFPSNGIIPAGQLPDSGDEVKFDGLSGITYISYLDYDFNNRDLYRNLFGDLTASSLGDQQKIDAVNNYVSEKLNYNEKQWDLGSPRRVLEKGSQYCGHLSSTMATILSVAYPTRVLHLSDGASPPNTHAVVEAFYDREWHMFDPTFGVKFKKRDDSVASYRDVRLDTSLISQDLFSSFRRKYPKVSLNWMPAVYNSGYHHVYNFRFKCSQYSHAWWNYIGDQHYLLSGGRILLAAAGVQPYTKVTYRIRKPGSATDELMFTTRGSGNSDCVLNQEESPQLDLEPGVYDVFVDLKDGNLPRTNGETPYEIRNWRLIKKLLVKDVP